jgi:NAD(P)-dependent dehydrogenase (short-subunit alcohol dehydrogenase family)
MAGKVLVTGAGGALGRAVVARLGAAGWQVASVVGRSAQGTLPAGSFGPVDLGDEVAAGAVIAQAAAWLGGLDAVVHLAGGFALKALEDSTLADWRAMQASNAESLFVTAKAALPLMADGGAIVAVGAASAAKAGAGMAAYTAAKSGVARLVEALAAELAPRGIRANAVLPGVIDTPANRRDMPRGNPAKWTHPDAIADAIAFLIGPQSRAVNGVGLAVNNPAGASA